MFSTHEIDAQSLGLRRVAGRSDPAQKAPPAKLAAGGFELCSGMSESAVGLLHAAWSARGVAIVAPPARAEFGNSFVALDPDGHRLRALAPTA
jgi:hypothetical protein